MAVFNGLSVGASSMENASTALQIIGNNLANLSTTGFKRTRAVGSDAFSSTLVAGRPGEQVGNGANRPFAQKITGQGNVQATGNALDIAVEGRGWFAVKAPNEVDPMFTRSGVFRLDENRILEHISGKRAQGFAFVNGVQQTTLSDVAITSTNILGQATTKVDLFGNLNSSAENLGTPPTFTSAVKRDEFVVVTGVNDQIVFQTGASPTPITASLTLNGGLASGTAVDGAALAAAVKQALDTTTGITETYNVSYDQATDKFTIENRAGNTQTITFLHDNAASTASPLLGFVASSSGTIPTGETEVSDVGVAFNVLAGVNDTLNLTIEGTARAVTVAAGNYTGKNLAFAIEKEARALASDTVGTRVTYSEDAPNSFQVLGPRTGGAHTINQPSNAATPTVAVPATQVTVTGGTLAATTGFDTGTAADGAGFFDISNAFTTSSASTAFDVFDGLGETHNLTMFFRKVGDNAWEWHAALKGSDLLGTTADSLLEEVASGFLRFTEDGKIESESTLAGTGIFNFDAVGGGAAPPPNQAIVFNFGDSIVTDGGTGLSGVSQFESANTDPIGGGRRQNIFTLASVRSDGIPKGDFEGLEITRKGLALAKFTNGQAVTIAQLPLTLFPGEGELVALSDNLFAATEETGLPVFVNPESNGAGALVSGSLEASNVDLADEFVEMILQQEIFQANARVVSTADDILQALVNLT